MGWTRATNNYLRCVWNAIGSTSYNRRNDDSDNLRFALLGTRSADRGRLQPLLIVLDEAHRFLPEGGADSAHRIFSMIAKEGRKYGVGLMLVTQRPSEIDSSVLSQCGSIIALRLTNTVDRSKVAATVPDDLGGLVDQLPALRTGEALILGDVMAVPSRIRVRKARHKPVGDDPKLPDVWQTPTRPDGSLYSTALRNWRVQRTGIGAPESRPITTDA